VVLLAVELELVPDAFETGAVAVPVPVLVLVTVPVPLLKKDPVEATDIVAEGVE